MRSTIFCKHYRAMSDNSTCAAGVAYDSFKGQPFEKRPCLCMHGEQPRPGCELLLLPTAEELEAEEREFERLSANLATARAAIVDHLGGPWKRGMPSAAGAIDCPVCGGKESLRFSRAGYNGHIHASCSTDGCVSWME